MCDYQSYKAITPLKKERLMQSETAPPPLELRDRAVLIFRCLCVCVHSAGRSRAPSARMLPSPQTTSTLMAPLGASAQTTSRTPQGKPPPAAWAASRLASPEMPRSLALLPPEAAALAAARVEAMKLRKTQAKLAMGLNVSASAKQELANKQAALAAKKAGAGAGAAGAAKGGKGKASNWSDSDDDDGGRKKKGKGRK